MVRQATTCNDSEPTYLDVVRWSLAGLIAVAMAMLAIGSRYEHAWRVCSAVLKGGRIVTETCGPYPISDLAPGLLILALLLLPDLDEFVLPGLGAFRVHFREREKRVAPIEANAMRHPSRPADGANSALANSPLANRRAATRARCADGQGYARTNSGSRARAGSTR
jgi:hypothetical protein